MPLAKHFIEKGINMMQIKEYLRSELVRAGFAGLDLQNTPLGVRITLRTSRPGLVIGKGGKRIQEITDVLQSRFGLEMPQIEVEEVQNPDLDAQIMAERLAYSLERGRHYRRAGYYILRKAMDAGAIGITITVAGKVTSQRARTQIFRAGTMKKSGQPSKDAVDKGVAQCIQKSGVLGVIVKIYRPGFRAGDGVKIDYQSLDKYQAQRSAELTKIKAADLKAIDDKTFVEKEIEESLDIESELIDDVNEDDISEISLEPKTENEEDK